MKKILTICIPTYNRSKTISKLLDEIVSSGLIDIVKVIVADDGSDDDTYTSLTSNDYGEEVTIIRHEHNIGMAAGYLQFIELCRTDYFMVFADDDMFSEDGIRKLVPFLLQVKPDYVATAWGTCDADILWKNKMRTNGTNSKIKIKDIRRATNHDSGCVYKTTAAYKHIVTMKTRLENHCYATYIFPSVVLTLLIAFSKNNCWWFKEVVGGYQSSGAMESNLLYNNEYKYVSVFGRWKEQVAFEDVYTYIYNTVQDEWKKKMAHQLLIRHRLEFYYRIEAGIQEEKPNLLEYLLIVSTIKSLRSPITFVKGIIKYLIERYQFMRYMK